MNRKNKLSKALPKVDCHSTQPLYLVTVSAFYIIIVLNILSYRRILTESHRSAIRHHECWALAFRETNARPPIWHFLTIYIHQMISKAIHSSSLCLILFWHQIFRARYSCPCHWMRLFKITSFRQFEKNR